jgi:NADH:ubiquinone reductase (non-electrogenic)
LNSRNTSIIEPIRWYFNRAGHSNASFVQATCCNIDAKKQIVYGVDVRGDEIEIDYDYLVVAVGAEPATFSIPGTKCNKWQYLSRLKKK